MDTFFNSLFHCICKILSPVFSFNVLCILHVTGWPL